MYPNRHFKKLSTYNEQAKDLPITIGGEIVEMVTKFKYLGVWIDHNFNWGQHIDHICTKVSQRLGILPRIRPFITLDTAKILYNALVLPILEYNCVVWGNCSKTHLDGLQNSKTVHAESY